MAEEHGAPSTDINTREVLWKIEDCKIKEWKDAGHSKASIEQKSARLRRVLEPLPYNDLVKRGLEFLYTKQSKRKIRYLVRKHLKETRSQAGVWTVRAGHACLYLGAVLGPTSFSVVGKG